MKFYAFNKRKNFYLAIIKNKKLTAIYSDSFAVDFFKDGLRSNCKEAAHIRSDRFKEYFFNEIYYGNSQYFTKKSWRRFIKLRAFL
jgi:hypothetical protein